jgi:twitching motility two-component system response regulator PilH
MPTAPLLAIVEDDPSILGFMQDVLGDEGYAVLPWRCAEGAQEMLRAECPTMVVLDIGLEHPRAGMEVLHAMREEPRTAGIAVLICTADRGFLDDHGAALRAMGCGTLEKPFVPDELVAAVAGLLDAR